MLAIRDGLQFTVDLGFQEVIVESDSLSTINLVREAAQSIRPICSLLSDIDIFKLDFRTISFCFVKRQANEPAHMLAKCGLGSLTDLIWIEESLIFSWDVILTDVLSYE